MIRLTLALGLERDKLILVNSGSIVAAYQDDSNPTSSTRIVLCDGGLTFNVEEDVDAIESLMKAEKGTT